MSEAKMIAMQRAEGLLKAAGVGYAIRLEDGTVLGNLPLAADKPTRAGYVKKNHFVRDYDYITAMRALNPGDTTSWDMGTHEKAVSFQKVVSAAAHRLWGSDSFITTQSKGGTGVEVLRVS